MKILHFFLAGLSVFLLISAGYASKKPKTRRQCYSLDGNCEIKCRFPRKKYGKCGLIQQCCISLQGPRENPIADNPPFYF